MRIYRKLGSIMTGHSIHKVCILAAAIAWLIVFVNYDGVKINVVDYNIVLIHA